MREKYRAPLVVGSALLTWLVPPALAGFATYKVGEALTDIEEPAYQEGTDLSWAENWDEATAGAAIIAAILIALIKMQGPVQKVGKTVFRWTE